jgi:hypothetical protein
MFKNATLIEVCGGDTPHDGLRFFKATDNKWYCASNNSPRAVGRAFNSIEEIKKTYSYSKKGKGVCSIFVMCTNLLVRKEKATRKVGDLHAGHVC